MKLAKHIKIIISQVENLEDLHSRLESLLQCIMKAIHEGKTWIDDKENTRSFLQINQLLIDGAAYCMKKCLEIANENEELSLLNHSSELMITEKVSATLFNSKLFEIDDLLQERLKKLKESISENSINNETTKSKLKDLKKENEIFARQLDDHVKKNDLKSEEIMKEFEAASNFMSNLQSKNENFSHTFEESNREILRRLKLLEEETINTSKESKPELTNALLMSEMEDRFKKRNTQIFGRLKDLEEKLEMMSKESKVQVNDATLKSEMNDQFEKMRIQILKNLNETYRQHELKTKSAMNEIKDQIETISKSNTDAISKTDSLAVKFNEMAGLNKLTDAFEMLKKDFNAMAVDYVAITKAKFQQIGKHDCPKTEYLMKKFAILENETKKISSKVEEYFNKNSGETAVGFVAKVNRQDTFPSLRISQVLNCFDDVLIDLQNNFEPETGIFTAPCDGLYLCCLMIDAHDFSNMCLQFEMFHKESDCGVENLVSDVVVSQRNTLATTVSFVKMSTKDTLYITSIENFDYVLFGVYSQFMCMLIHKY